VRSKGTFPQRIKKDIANMIDVLEKKAANDPEYQSTYEGPEFPQANEIELIITMC